MTKSLFELNVFSCWILALLLLSCGKDGDVNTGQEEETPAPEQFIFQADPTIFFNENKYYLYGTDGYTPNKGIKVFVSSDLKDWKTPEGIADGFAVRTLESFGTQGFWAPQVWKYNNKFYMAYVANEQIAIGTATKPEGPFSASGPIAFDQKNIDPFVFFDDDGKKYLYHVDITNGNKIYVAAINDDFTAIDKSTRTLCLTATEPWEIIQARVVEGPTVLKRNNLYYLIYTANHFENQQYAVGYATSASPMGPWTKATENPILSMSNSGKPGIGHGDMFTDASGGLNYVFHTHNAMDKVSPRRTGMIKARFVAQPGTADKLVMEISSLYYLKTK